MLQQYFMDVKLRTLIVSGLLTMAVAFPEAVFSQTVETSAEQLQREGRYVNVTVQMGNPLKIFVAGKERARISTDNMKMEIKTLNKNGWEELKLNKFGNYYSADVATEQAPGGLLEVRTTLKNKKRESFKFNLK